MTVTDPPAQQDSQALLRKALKRSLPGSALAVQPHGTAHGWWVVMWVDGPSQAQVWEAVAAFGDTRVSCERRYSPVFAAQVALERARAFPAAVGPDSSPAAFAEAVALQGHILPEADLPPELRRAADLLVRHLNMGGVLRAGQPSCPLALAAHPVLAGSGVHAWLATVDAVLSPHGP